MKKPKIILKDGTNYRKSMMPFQKDFHESEHKISLLGGSVGIGKTVAACVKVIDDCWEYEDNYGLILRQDMPRLRKSIMKDLDGMLFRNGLMIKYNKNENTRHVLNRRGKELLKTNPHMKKSEAVAMLEQYGGLSEIEYASFESSEEALQKFRSTNLGFFVMEQAEEASEEVLVALIERIRRNPSGRRGILICNPEPNSYLYNTFHPESETRNPNTGYFTADTKDALFLPDDYVDTMDEFFDEDRKKQMMNSDWTVNTKAVFPEFSVKHNVIEHQEIPFDWQHGIGIDWGIQNATAVVFGAKHPTLDFIYVYDEIWEKSDKVTVSGIAEMLHERIDYDTICAIDQSTKQRDGRQMSVFSDFRAAGIPVIPSSRDPAAGIARIREYIKIGEELVNPFSGKKGSPRVVISEKCINLIRELRAYRWEDQKSGLGQVDPPQKPRSYKCDAVDAFRYFMMRVSQPLSEESTDPTTPPVRTQRRMPDEVQVNPYIRENKDAPHGYDMGIDDMVNDAMKKPETRRTVWRRRNGIAVGQVLDATPPPKTRKGANLPSKPKYKMLNGVPVPI